MPSRSKPVFNLTDFTGGLQESDSSYDYNERQWSELKGVVLDGPSSLRSQWECQSFNVPGTMTAVRAFDSGSGKFLVALTSSGAIYWALAPSDTTGYASTSASTTWTALTNATSVATGSTVSIPSNTAYRILCEIPLEATSAGPSRNGLLLNAAADGSSAVVIYDNPSSAGTLTAKIYEGSVEDSRYAAWFYANEKGTVTGDTDLDVIPYAKAGCMPHGTVGVMWGDVLCVAGTRWYKSQADAENYDTVDFDNSSAAENVSGFWTSFVSPTGRVTVDAFHPYLSFNTGFLSPEATITDLVVCDQGLLVFTTSGGSRSGVILLRGSAYSYKPVVVHAYVGTADTALSNSYSPVVGYWPETAIAVFVEASGTIWYTDGEVADRLDRVGPQAVASAWGDHAQGFGQYMLVARSTRLLCLNLTARDASSGGASGSAAWTELVLPAAYPVKSMSVLGSSLYFIQNGVIYRFTAAGSLRGKYNGNGVTCTVTSPVLSDDTAVNRFRWAYFAVLVHGTGTITGSSSRPRGPLASLPAGTQTTAQNVTVSADTKIVAKGHGPSRLASFTITFTGDVFVDGFTVYVFGRQPELSRAGAG